MSTLLDGEQFVNLANLVTKNRIGIFIETDAKGSNIGVEAATRLMLRGYICDNTDVEKIAREYPEQDLYDGNPELFLKEVLPKIDRPALFWMDPNEPNHDQLMELIQKDNIAKNGPNWFVLEKAPKALSSPFDQSDSSFDRNFVGPDELKPKVYRNQREKDIWHGCVVENEYRLGDLQADDAIIDIGAHIGSFSFLAHKKGSRKIYAFEVDPWHIEAASANLEGMDGVKLYHSAVVRSDLKREAQSHYNGNWHVFENEGQTVENLSLDEIIAEIGPVRFIKIDCEGSEWPILYTCTKLAQVQEIAGEYHTDVNWEDAELPKKSPFALLKFLYDQGFTHLEFKQGGGPHIGLFYAKR